MKILAIEFGNTTHLLSVLIAELSPRWQGDEMRRLKMQFKKEPYALK